MSTTTDTPRQGKKTEKAKESKPNTSTPEARAKANDFSEQLLNKPWPTNVNGVTTSKKEKNAKKRQRDHTTTDTAREESPRKKRRDIIAEDEFLLEATRTEAPSVVAAEEPSSRMRRKSHAVRDFAEESTLRTGDSPQVAANTSHGRRLPKPARTGTVSGLPAELESPFASTTVSFKVTVPPVSQLYPLEGALAYYISPLLLTWHPQLDGILLAYNNAKLHTSSPDDKNVTVEEEQPMARAIDECAAPYIWLTLDALVFSPKKGLEMEGYLNLQNESHITLILWNFFTVTISHKRVPKGWVFHEYYEQNGDSTANVEEGGKPMRCSNEQWGAWYDSQGNEVDGLLRFRIKDWDCAPPGSNGDGSFLSIEGSMLTVEEEKDLEAELEHERRQKRAASAIPRRRTPLPSALKGGASVPTGLGANTSLPDEATLSTAGNKQGKARKAQSRQPSGS